MATPPMLWCHIMMSSSQSLQMAGLRKQLTPWCHNISYRKCWRERKCEIHYCHFWILFLPECQEIPAHDSSVPLQLNISFFVTVILSHMTGLQTISNINLSLFNIIPEWYLRGKIVSGKIATWKGFLSPLSFRMTDLSPTVERYGCHRPQLADNIRTSKWNFIYLNIYTHLAISIFKNHSQKEKGGGDTLNFKKSVYIYQPWNKLYCVKKRVMFCMVFSSKCLLCVFMLTIGFAVFIKGCRCYSSSETESFCFAS